MLRKKEQTPRIILDVGTEAIKVMFPEKYLQYLDEGYTTQEKALEEVFKKISKKARKVVLGLPASTLKARVVSQTFIRQTPKDIIDEKEGAEIQRFVLQAAQKEVTHIFSGNSGILPQDLRVIDSKIMKGSIKIDGYEVPKLEGYEGRSLEFKILATFLLEREETTVEKIVQTKTQELKIAHVAQGLLDLLSEHPDGIFIDVGGEITQVFLARGGQLEGVGEFNLGGKTFSEAISEKLGLSCKDARLFKERYARKELSEDARHRIKETLYWPARTWFENLKLKLKELQVKSLTPSVIFLFGGGSQLPEIKAVLKESSWDNISFAAEPRVKSFKNPQFITSSLLMKS